MRIIISPTPYKSIRVYIYYEGDKLEVLNSPEATFFKSVSIWGGHDKDEQGMISYELPKYLKEFLEERFELRKDVEFSGF